MHLADLLVAVAVFGVVSASTFTVLQEGLRVYMVGAARAESQQSARVAVERLAGEIRTAGLGPSAWSMPENADSFGPYSSRRPGAPCQPLK